MGFICSKVILVFVLLGCFSHFKVLKDEGCTALGEGASPLPACWNYMIQSIPKGKIQGLCGPCHSWSSSSLTVRPSCSSLWQPETREAPAELTPFIFIWLPSRQDTNGRLKWIIVRYGFRKHPSASFLGHAQPRGLGLQALLPSPAHPIPILIPIAALPNIPPNVSPAASPRGNDELQPSIERNSSYLKTKPSERGKKKKWLQFK